MCIFSGAGQRRAIKTVTDDVSRQVADKAGKGLVPKPVIDIFNNNMQKVGNQMAPGLYPDDPTRKAKGVVVDKTPATVAKRATTVARSSPLTSTRGAVKKRSTMLTKSRGKESPATIRRKTLLGA